VVDRFEEAVARYTGAPYCVAVDSCTNAIFLALLYERDVWQPPPWVILPRRTYVGVAQAARNAGYDLTWRSDIWSGSYRLEPTSVVDSAKRFTSEMYLNMHLAGTLTCLSFHAGKILKIGRGGAILTESRQAVDWLRRGRFDGRTAGDDAAAIQVPGYHCYMTPEAAARGLQLLSWLPEKCEDVPNMPGEYDDLSLIEAFR